MKLTTFTLLLAMVAVGSSAPKAMGQNPDAIDNARSVAKSLQQQQASGSNAATPSAKPVPGAPAPAVKPAVIPGNKPAAAATPKVAAKAAASSQHDQLQHVNVVPGSNDIQIEISSSSAATPKVTKLTSPTRLLVELPDTVVATAQNKIPVGSGGVKGVRIGMDGKNPPTTSVVVDLEKPLAYDIAPGPAGKVVLILHTQDSGAAVAKTAPAPAAKAPAPVAKAPVPPTKAAAPAVQAQASAKPVAAPKVADVKTPAGKPVAAPAVAVAKSPMAPVPVAVPAGKPGTPAPKVDAKATAKTTVVAAKPTPASPVAVAVPPAKPEAAKQPKPEEKKWAMTGKRDPFFSPVVQTAGSGCSTGKKCLEIGSINLRGVVKSDTGFIAVVTNNLGKAYFLRENDPVFNGYVVKITGDSVTFQETMQDKLGKSFTREVVKRIFTPAV